jgi:ATP-dependent protease ClpP protease subunit
MKTWFTARATHGVAELSIYDEIGSYGVPAKAFIDEMKSLGNISELTLRINSPGGSVFDGIAIYNALKRHPAKVIVTVEGLAASIASVIALHGSREKVAFPNRFTLKRMSTPNVAFIGGFGRRPDWTSLANRYNVVSGAATYGSGA